MADLPVGPPAGGPPGWPMRVRPVTGQTVRRVRGGPRHLAKRLIGSLSNRPPDPRAVRRVEQTLGSALHRLWLTMSHADRRHSIEVAGRFERLRPGATDVERAGALLHDVGKVRSGLTTLGRVAATIIGPRGARFRAYHDHEAIGAAMVRDAGGAEAVAVLVGGSGPAAADLRRADDG